MKKFNRRQFFLALLAPVIAFFVALVPKPVRAFYKGTSPFDAGYFYCPYIPLQTYSTIPGGKALQYKPSQIIHFKTRYADAKPLEDTGYYRTVKIA